MLQAPLLLSRQGWVQPAASCSWAGALLQMGTRMTQNTCKGAPQTLETAPMLLAAHSLG